MTDDKEQKPDERIQLRGHQVVVGHPDSDPAESAGADPFLDGLDQRGADAAAASCLRDLKIGELGQSGNTASAA